MATTQSRLAALIWKVADLLRGEYKQSEYGRIILPFTVLRRMDCVLEPTRELVRAKDKALSFPDKDDLICDAIGLRFFNRSKQNFGSIGSAPEDARKNLDDYLNGFSAEAREILDKYDFRRRVAVLDARGLLYQVVQAFAAFDLSPAAVNSHDMGFVFEDLIRRFADTSNETAGEHFTPREVVELMVNLMLAPDLGTFTPGAVINIFDPACGTGGMLSAAQEHIADQTRNAPVTVGLFGQELNEESYAICRSDMLIKGEELVDIKLGNSFSDDQFRGRTFDYMLANPPFGVEWKKVEDEIRSRF